MPDQRPEFPAIGVGAPVDALTKASRAWRNRFDPIYRLLDLVAFRRLLLSRLDASRLESAECEFLTANLQKHRLILWANVLLSLLLFTRQPLTSNADFFLLVMIGIPTLVSGITWYTISFSGIPERFIESAMLLTGGLYLVFTFGLSAMLWLGASRLPSLILIILLLPSYLIIYFIGILYDNLDGLKIGLDTKLFRYSRASLRYYQRHGVNLLGGVGDSAHSTEEVPGGESTSLYMHYVTLLEKNVAQLEGGRTASVANHIIATSTDLLFRLIGLADESAPSDDRYLSYVATSHKMTVDDVNDLTVKYVRLAIERLRVILGRAADQDIEDVEQRLREFDQVRRAALRGDALVQGPEGGQAGSHLNQTLADYLFAQVFEMLLSLVKSHRHKFLVTRGEQRAANS